MCIMSVIFFTFGNVSQTSAVVQKNHLFAFMDKSFLNNANAATLCAIGVGLPFPLVENAVARMVVELNINAFTLMIA